MSARTTYAPFVLSIVVTSLLGGYWAASVAAQCFAYEEITPSGDNPDARSSAAMVYDESRHRMILFGGTTDFASSAMSDTWEGTWSPFFAWEWTQVGTGGMPGRYWHAMAYDSDRQRVVVHGGAGSSSSTTVWYDTTYEGFWNGMSWQWTLVASGVPADRGGHAMAYDSARGVMVLFGGREWNGNTNTVYADTWTWDGTTWVQMTPPGTPGVDYPSARWTHAMAYDARRDRVVLFGGRPIGGSLSDTWEWNGATNTWTQMSPPHSPSARYGHAMTYDAGRGVIVLYGGYPWSDQTWEWDGVDWTQISTASRPAARAYPAMAYDALWGYPVVFGGHTSSTPFTLRDDSWRYWVAPRFASNVTQPQPIDTTIFAGQPAEFAVSMQTIGGTPSYQWRRDGLPLSDDGRIVGSQAATLTIDPTVPSDLGAYDCVITNTCGERISMSSTFDSAPGDLDGDNDFDEDDIDAFVLALTDPAAYAAAYPDGNYLSGDFDRDGDVDGDDIQVLLDWLFG